jgi:hypothetical protein
MTADPMPGGQPPQEARTCYRDTPCPDCADRPLTFDGNPRCTAWSTTRGHRCERARHPGATVCASHGASAPQVKARARLRLLELVDPATAVLAQILTDTRLKPADRLRAVENIYDRAGIPRRTEVDHGAAQAMLLARIQEVIARREAPNLPAAQDTVRGELENPDERMEA